MYFPEFWQWQFNNTSSISTFLQLWRQHLINRTSENQKKKSYFNIHIERSIFLFAVAALHSPVWLYVTPQTVAHQAPLSMGFPARILEWVAISYSTGSSWPRDWIHIWFLEEEEGVTTSTNDKVIDPKRIMCTGEEETSICLNYTANLKTASTLRKVSLKTHLKKKTTQRNVDQINSWSNGFVYVITLGTTGEVVP